VKHIQDHSSAVIGIKFIDDTNSSEIRLVSADTKGVISVRSIDEELQLTEPIKKDMTGNKVYCMINSENNIFLGMDKKVQISQLKSNNSIISKKSGGAVSASVREYIKMEADEVSLY
jgi:hypothetical protein